jgi:2,5-diketo-D-gluconate reductase A
MWQSMLRCSIVLACLELGRCSCQVPFGTCAHWGDASLCCDERYQGSLKDMCQRRDPSLCHHAQRQKLVVDIAAGMRMPLINLGGTKMKPSNYSLWFELGGRGIDTAWSYGDDVQSSVGHAVSTSSIPPSQIFITTKVPCCSDHTFFTNCLPRWDGKAPADVVMEAAEADLELLNVSSVDLVLLHSPCDSWTDTLAAYKALEKLKVGGKARAIGISNFNASLIDALLSSVDIKPVLNQCGFSIGYHGTPRYGSDLNTFARCQELGIAYSAFSPLGGLTGVDVLKNPDVIAIATAHNRTAAQVALRWLVQQEIVVVTASTKASHLESDLDIFSFVLSSDEMSRLTAIGQTISTLV